MSQRKHIGSFAIYLAIILIISELSVSAFNIQQWTRTTTLKPSLDLTGQESALLEVRNDLPKINNAKERFIKKEMVNVIRDTFKAQLGTNVPTRTSENMPNVNSKVTERASTKKLISNNTLKTLSEADRTTETIQDLSNLEKNESTLINVDTVFTTTSVPINTTTYDTSLIPKTSTVSYEGAKQEKKILNYTTNNQNNKGFTTEAVEITTKVIDNVNEPNILTEVSQLHRETTPHSKISFVSNSTNNNDESAITDLTILESETTLSIGKENEATDIFKMPTETMAAEATSYMTTNPSWKTYTVIERKRLKSLDAGNPSTESSELLTKAETIPVKVTLENEPHDTTILSMKDVHRQLKDDSESQDTMSNVETSSHSSIDQQTTHNIKSKFPSTLSLNTVADNVVSSKRAGFLDLKPTQSGSEDKTTTDTLGFNETEIIGALFEVDLQENDGPEMKNGSESRSQMVDDAIEKKLLEEQVLNDDLMKTYRKQSSIEPNEGKKESITDDSLSVKPINTKTGLYTVRPNYKKMKKIEVQPLKQFVRDPDDNSWRNESLSLLGIVFKAKNASKPFTQVLKNKTEAVLSNMSEKDAKNEITDLRERLEKIAEVRKSQKKKYNKAGDSIYSDYEEGNSGESTSKTDTTLPLFNNNGKLAFNDRPTSPPVAPESTTLPGVYMFKEQILTTRKPKKLNKFSEYYDTTDEYDADYLALPKLDLKKFTTSAYKMDTLTTPPTPLTTHTKPLATHWPDRKPTVQYFPPRPHSQKVNLNDYDNDFEKRVNMFSFNAPPKDMSHMLAGIPPTILPRREPPTPKHKYSSPPAPTNKPDNLFKNFYATLPSRLLDSGNRHTAGDDESFNRASYVIKHFKDLIDEAVKHEYAYTDSPLAGVTVDDMVKGKLKSSMDDDYDYMSNIHKEILNRFVDNFNKNSEKFKVDFPVLYNNSVVHRKAHEDGGAVASSTAFLKRQYGGMPAPKRCDPNCDLKVELSPAYELHYYVPDQEEKEEADPKPPTSPFMYRL